jgi:hypothetical protein
MSQSSSGRCGISKSLEYFTQFFIIFFISIAAGLLATIFVYTEEEEIISRSSNNNHTDSSRYDYNGDDNLVTGYIIDVASNSNIILIKAN